MAVIIITVVIQGVLVPSENRGTISKEHIFINSGIFQAIGVISFGKMDTLFYACSIAAG